ncbi:single-stranded-DNA-specific exonuclease RecJ [Sulfurovum sp. zt1-1]|uniref:Single-stranded-DNA-specific exonuclease RecJ n=1 Tax=Sulfurovum zhangzhouensis TaxID=3019067 RepID=A0ABT7R0K7_9BACT|nr:single-stranded-DNA-specific exonuclease RecJ [Sulfurovum zhangzhouensis]MDM5272593.1 single-stranded-DNA-specific exonuclease RecJ [Sulfurovum zhangzhouensis]
MSLTSTEIISTLSSRNLDVGYKSLAEIPHFSKMKDMIRGAKRLADAVRNKEQIFCVGDYDADGSCSTATCVSFFNDIGYPIKWVIPNRFTDGYGVSPSVLERIGDTDVIFTVDNGIAAHDAAEVCKERGIDLLITDHHTPGSLIPDCYAVINPKQDDCEYPFKDGSGCFVTWLLCCAIKHELGLDTDMGKYLDLVALSTITDVMPLVGINRHIVKYGLQKINTLKRPFFKELALSMGKDSFSYEDLGFQVGPRINAAGRLEHASLAVEAILASENEAQQLVRLLTEVNQRRKTMQSEMTENILELTEGQKDFIVVHSDSLHEGIVGIIAAKVAETTGYPTIVLTTAEDGLLKGSGRTVGVVNIYELVNECSNHLEKFGGHAGACGLSLRAEKLDTFIEAVRAVSRRLPREAFEPLNTAIGDLSPANADLDLYYQIEKFAPFGEGNPEPVFHCKEATIINSRAVGKEEDHTRLSLSWEGKEVTVMAFNSDVNNYPKGSKITFNYRLDLNEWNGKVNLQFMPTSKVKIK